MANLTLRVALKNQSRSMDLFARNVIGWSMKPTLARELVLDAILMAVWRRKPKTRVLIHSDQGTQYGSEDWQ